MWSVAEARPSMRLSTRLALILVPATLVTLTAAFVVASVGFDGRSGIVGGFKDVEEGGMRDSLGEARQAMHRDLGTLDATARDWAHWNDTHQFVRGEFPEYEAIDLTANSFAGYGISFMVFLDADGGSVYASGFDASTRTFQPLPAALRDEASRAALGLPRLTDTEGHVAGLVLLDDAVHLVSSWAILDSSEEGPSAGTMTWGRRVDASYQEALAATTEEAIALFAWTRPAGADAAAAATLEADGDTTVDGRRDDLLVGYTRMDDLRGEPALLVKLSADRPILEEAYESLTFAYLAALLVVVAFVGGVLMLLRRFVTGRVRRLAHHMEELRSGAMHHEAEIQGTDEVAELAATFDALVADLAKRTADLETSNTDLKRFASVVSHDLKSPLTTFLLTLSILRKDAEERNDAKAVEHLERLQRNANGMVERINAILEYSKAAQAAVPDGVVDAAVVMDEILDDLAGEVTTAKAQIHVHPLPKVRGSAEQVKQVLQNLVANGIKYARPGEPPRITVRGYETSEATVVEVEDEGLGFEDSDVRDMFTPFRRLERTKGIPGHGIGLATVARIMQRHGGRVEAKGKLGEGSTFTLVFPRTRRKPGAYGAEVDPVPQP